MNIQSHPVTKPTFETFEVRFDGFEDLPARKGQDSVESQEFTCFGHRWCLELYPGGARQSDDGYVAVYLAHKSDSGISLQATFIILASEGTEMTHARLVEQEYEPEGDDADAWGRKDFAKRSAIIDSIFGALQDGALVIQVQMRPTNPMPAYLENPVGKMILKKFMDDECADVKFEVGTVSFPAHRVILQDSAPYLYNLSTSSTESTVISIEDVKPEIFHHMLYYIYGGKVSEEDLKSNTMEIISAADKYEVVGLKLEAEAILVSFTTITFENVMKLLLCADEKNCALLKEAAMDFLVKNKDEVPSKVSFDDVVPGHLMKDVFVALNMNDNMRVSTLREKLHAKGLEVDGSREAMIALLEENP